MDAVLATMGSNAQATTKGAIMFLTNFIFISVISFIVLAFLGFPPWEVISGRSPEFRTESAARLRGKLQRLPCCGGSRVGCFGLNAGATPATTEITWARERRRFFRSEDRRARDPRTALVLIRHS